MESIFNPRMAGRIVTNKDQIVDILSFGAPSIQNLIDVATDIISSLRMSPSLPRLHDFLATHWTQWSITFHDWAETGLVVEMATF